MPSGIFYVFEVPLTADRRDTGVCYRFFMASILSIHCLTQFSSGKWQARIEDCVLNRDPRHGVMLSNSLQGIGQRQPIRFRQWGNRPVGDLDRTDLYEIIQHISSRALELQDN